MQRHLFAVACAIGLGIAIPAIAKEAGDDKKHVQAAQSREPALEAEEKLAQISILEQLSGFLKTCEEKFQSYRVQQQMARTLYITAMRARDARERAGLAPKPEPQLEPVNESHKECGSKTKNFVLTRSQKLLGTFKNIEMRQRVKESLAQWLTAIDAISDGSALRDAEVAKFQTKVNLLKLDLQ